MATLMAKTIEIFEGCIVWDNATQLTEQQLKLLKIHVRNLKAGIVREDGFDSFPRSVKLALLFEKLLMGWLWKEKESHNEEKDYKILLKWATEFIYDLYPNTDTENIPVESKNNEVFNLRQ